MSRPIKRKKIHEEIIENLVKDITDGIYTPGDLLPSERDLMEEFHVGRPAVREAVTRLELQGLIDIRSGQRARVRKPTIERIMGEMNPAIAVLLSTENGNAQLKEIRIFFETALAREAAMRARPDHIEYLKNLLEKNRESAGNTKAFSETDIQFHRYLAEMTGNEILINLMRLFNQWLIRHRIDSLKHPGQIQEALNAHEKIFNAIEEKDSMKADNAMRTHITQVYEQMSLEENGQ
ncbi:MAG: FCD domain-containing protein [Spirochaetaceae bacterium]|jgi:DNA-binding FadR family transcriptional regulator|nr:FCD domain-containing protein [Spirochaetaceae bacterium]